MAIIELTEHTYVARVWYVAWLNTDWLAVLHREAHAPWHLTYRFRYYTDADPDRKDTLASEDRKFAYKVALRDPADGPERLIEVTDRLASELARANGAQAVSRLIVNGSAEAFLNAMQAQPWCHTTVMPPTPPQTM